MGICLALSLATAWMFSPIAHAASSWNPTLLVNTEAFQTIDSGDGSTDMELRFGNGTQRLFYRTTGRFEFSKPLWVQGDLTATGAITTKGNLSGETLIVSGVAGFSGATTFGAAVTARSSVTVRGTLSGQTLRVGVGGADVHGTLTASGSVRTDGDLTLNDDQTAADTILTFGQPTTNQTLKYLNTAGKFQFSRGLSVLGTITGSALNVDRNATVGGTLTATGTIIGVGAIKARGDLSGSTLTVDGNLNVHGLSYSLPATRGAASTFLKENGAGALTWSTVSAGNGSGEIVSLHPEYAGANYFASGSTSVGQLSGSGGTSALDNSYLWTSTRSGIQNYWISVRVRLPDNFSSWDPVKPIELKYKTGSGTVATNHVTVRIKDTGGTTRALTGGGGLANTAWTIANITGPESTGTWSAKGYITIYVKMATTSGGNAAVGYINLNFETTTP